VTRKKTEGTEAREKTWQARRENSTNRVATEGYSKFVPKGSYSDSSSLHQQVLRLAGTRAGKEKNPSEKFGGGDRGRSLGLTKAEKKNRGGVHPSGRVLALEGENAATEASSPGETQLKSKRWRRSRTAFAKNQEKPSGQPTHSTVAKRGRAGKSLKETCIEERKKNKGAPTKRRNTADEKKNLHTSSRQSTTCIPSEAKKTSSGFPRSHQHDGLSPKKRLIRPSNAPKAAPSGQTSLRKKRRKMWGDRVRGRTTQGRFRELEVMGHRSQSEEKHPRVPTSLSYRVGRWCRKCPKDSARWWGCGGVVCVFFGGCGGFVLQKTDPTTHKTPQKTQPTPHETQPNTKQKNPTKKPPRKWCGGVVLLVWWLEIWRVLL